MVRAACFERTRVTKILPTPVTICIRAVKPYRVRVCLALVCHAAFRLRTSQISQDSVVQLYASEPISRGEVASGQWAPEALWWGVETPHTVSVVTGIRDREREREKNGDSFGWRERGETVRTETREGEDRIADRCVGGRTCEPKPSAARWWRAARECGMRMVRQHGARCFLVQEPAHLSSAAFDSTAEVGCPL